MSYRKKKGNSLNSLLLFSYYKIGTILNKHGIKTFSNHPLSCNTMPGNDSLGLQHAGVYSIPCECRKNFIGQNETVIIG